MIVYSIVPPSPTRSDNDDRWDADAVHFLLRSGGASRGWTYTALLGCLRERPAVLRANPHGVEITANLARQFGVEKRYEASGERRTVHLYRTDPLAPAYPVTPYERRTLLRIERSAGGAHRICAVCGHLGVPIVWGMVSGPDPRTERGEVVLGGCCVEPVDTQCIGCGRRWDAAVVDQSLAPMGSLVPDVHDV